MHLLTYTVGLGVCTILGRPTKNKKIYIVQLIASLTKYLAKIKEEKERKRKVPTNVADNNFRNFFL